jgi:hypothetical protein
MGRDKKLSKNHYLCAKIKNNGRKKKKATLKDIIIEAIKKRRDRK